MAIQTWSSPLDVLGLAAYLTIMTGAPPDRELLAAARREPSVRVGVAPLKAKRNLVSSGS